jgi:hypothetical protein
LTSAVTGQSGGFGLGRSVEKLFQGWAQRRLGALSFRGNGSFSIICQYVCLQYSFTQSPFDLGFVGIGKLRPDAFARDVARQLVHIRAIFSGSSPVIRRYI